VAEATGEAAAAGEVHAASARRTAALGRVVCDAEGGRLNEASVLLEGTAAHSEGQRVRLELRALPSFALFPGQAVQVEGANPSGYCLVADRLVAGAPGRRPPAPPPAPLQLLVAAGPFSGPADGDCAPLDALLNYALRARPDVLLLCGPFVDAEAPFVRNCVGEATFEQQFEDGVCTRLARFAAAQPATRLVLQPSPRDAHADQAFPQRPLELPAACGAAFSSAPNPARLTLDGRLQLAACSADVLKALSGAEASRAGPTEGDRIARLASHLLGQRSLYPLFPAPPGLNLDCGRAAAALALPAPPHLLILPSDLAPFAKVLAPALAVSSAPKAEAAEGDTPMEEPPGAEDAQDTVCVNPGRLARGTCALIRILRPADSAAVFSASVRVDLVRLGQNKP